MVMFSKNWLSSLFSMIENGSVVVTHARAASLSTAVDSVAKWRMRNVRDYDPPKDYHCVATSTQKWLSDSQRQASTVLSYPVGGSVVLCLDGCTPARSRILLPLGRYQILTPARSRILPPLQPSESNGIDIYMTTVQYVEGLLQER